MPWNSAQRFAFNARALNASVPAAAFLERSLLIRPLGSVVYFMPPYVITDGEAARTLGAIATLIRTIQWIMPRATCQKESTFSETPTQANSRHLRVFEDLWAQIAFALLARYSSTNGLV